MTALDLPAIRALHAAATPGPWFANRYYVAAGEDQSDPDAEIARASFKADAAFIAAAPSIVAQLLAVVERVEGLAAKYDYEADRLAAKAENYIQGEVQSRYLGYAADTRMKASLIRAALAGEGL